METYHDNIVKPKTQFPLCWCYWRAGVEMEGEIKNLSLNWLSAPFMNNNRGGPKTHEGSCCPDCKNRQEEVCNAHFF